MKCKTPSKTKHQSRNGAAIERKSLQRKLPDLTFNVYKCECGFWHVGKPTLENKIKQMPRINRQTWRR